MKIIKSTLFLTLAYILTSCAGGIQHDRLFTGKIVRDCSGTYLRVDDKGDYHVCNDKLLADKKEGETVSVVYDFAKDCPEKNGTAVCMLYHENKGMIRIKSLK